MLIEGYVFIPYQGQVRFRFEAFTSWPWSPSDRAYDKLFIKSETHHHGQRPITCREIISHDERNNELRIKIYDIVETQVRPFFENADPRTLFECEMSAETGDMNVAASCIFCLVSK